MSKSSIRALLTAAAIVVPSLAMAHTGHGEVSGLAHGFAHPVGGLDHILAMVMVGVLAAQLGGRALWLVPASFVAVMALGGVLGLAGLGLPFVELGIALSIVVLGSHIRPMQSGTRFTTFSIPREQMARRATQMLCERIEASSKGGQVLLDCEPVEGETLGTIQQETDLK